MRRLAHSGDQSPRLNHVLKSLYSFLLGAEVMHSIPSEIVMTRPKDTLADKRMSNRIGENDIKADSQWHKTLTEEEMN
ncbi:hypothetical protein R3I94_021349 [Phoxinus phoxinus]